MRLAATLLPGVDIGRQQKQVRPHIFEGESDIFLKHWEHGQMSALAV
jgi:hypothetical protein